MDDRLTEALDAIRARDVRVWDARGTWAEASDAITAAKYDVPHLLTAVEALLEQHSRGRRVVAGSLCKRHESYSCFSITDFEADSLVACKDCKATVYDSCAACGDWKPLDECAARLAISGALLAEATP